MIETERLLLTWPTSSQIDQYYDDIIGTNMFDTICWDGPVGPNDMHETWERRKTHDPNEIKLALGLAVIEKKTNQFVGGVSLRPVNNDPAIADIGYAFAPKFQGQGFATEAIKALIDEAFAKRKSERIFATIFVGNKASRNVVEKVGFILEGTIRRAVLKRGQWLDAWILAITRPDWEQDS